jgi:uncharacterized repeat protein (TIGR01451 family)
MYRFIRRSPNDANRFWLFRSRRRRLVLLATVSTCGAALTFAIAAGATLTGGSTFESGDGNLVVNTPGLADWNAPLQPIICPPVAPGTGTDCGLDLVSSGSDNIYGGGVKEDNQNPALTTGQPTPKDDLSRFYVNQQFAGGNNYLYLAWERPTTNGDAHVDFEFNQSSTVVNGTPTRTAGDLLVIYDFGGSGAPTLKESKWITTSGACETSQDSPPCWGTATGFGSAAEAAVNTGSVFDANSPPAAGTTLSQGGEFGEAGINLTAANVFPAGTCEAFGSAFAKSRASSSTSAQLKDIISPISVHISNCPMSTVTKAVRDEGHNDTDSGSYASTATASPGDVIDYQLTYTNSGGTPATGVTLSDTLAAGQTFLDCSNTCTHSGQAVSWTLGDVAPGATVTRDVEVTLDSSFPQATTTIDNVASGCTASTTPNCTPSNHTTVTVNSPPASTVTKAVRDDGQSDTDTTGGYTSSVNAIPGDFIDYQITYKNSGGSPATGVTLTDTLAAGQTFKDCTGGCNSTSLPTVTWSLGTVGAGQSVTVDVEVQLDSSFSQTTTTINNSATGCIGTSCTTSPPTTVTVTATPASTVMKAVRDEGQPDPVSATGPFAPSVNAVPGDFIDYQVTYKNSGSGPATGVTVSDTLAAGQMFSECSNSCTQSGSLITWTLGTVAPGASVVLDVEVRLNATFLAPSTTIDNFATGCIGSACTPSNHTTVTVTSAPASTVTKAVRDEGQTDNETGSYTSSVNAVPSDFIDYQLKYTNSGTSPANNVTLTDTLAAGQTFQECSGGGGCTLSGSTVSWSLGTVAPNATVTVDVEVKLDATFPQTTTSIDNFASGCIGTSCTPSNHTTVTVTANAASTVAKGVRDEGQTDTDTGNYTTSVNAVPSDFIDYQISYTNSGTTPANNVFVTDVLAAGQTFVSCSNTASVPCTHSGQNVSWSLGTVAPNQTVIVDVEVQLASTFPQTTTTILNVANGCIGSTTTNCTPTTPPTTVTVTAAPATMITKLVRDEGQADTDSGTFAQTASAVPSDFVDYQISYTNSGTAPANNVFVTDTLAAGQTFVSCSSGCTQSGQNVSWSLGTVAPNQTVVVDVEVLLDATFPQTTTTINNVASGCIGSATTNCTPTTPPTTVTVTAAPATTITKLVRDEGQTDTETGTYAQTASAVPSDYVDYQISYTNSGTAPATPAFVTDTLAAGQTFVSCSNGCTQSGSTVTWNLGTVAPNQTVVVDVEVKLDATFPQTTTTINNVASGCIGSATTNCTPTTPPTTVTVTAAPATTITKLVRDEGQTDTDSGTYAQTASAVPSDYVDYQISYTNSGTAPANNVFVTDTLAAGQTFVSCSNGCTQSGSTVTWNLGTVAPNQTVVVDVEVKLDATFPQTTTTINNVASGCIGSATTNCTMTTPPTTVTVTAAPATTITKLVRDEGQTDTDSGTYTQTASAVPGDYVDYQISYTNSGTGPANSTFVTDALAAGQTFVSCSSGCMQNGANISWSLGTVSPNQTVVVDLEVKLDASFPSGQTPIHNVANGCIGSATTNCTPTTPPTTVTVTAAPNLALVKSANATHGNPGDQIVYKIAYSNTGNAPATGAVITEQVPAGTSLVSCSPACAPGGAGDPAGTTETWSIGTVAAGANGSVTMTVSVLNTVGCTITNTAKISSPDENGGVLVSSNPLTLTSTPGPNPAGAHASGTAYGAKIDALLGLVSLPPTASANSSQSGIGSKGNNATALNINLLNTLGLSLLDANTRSRVTSSPAQATQTSTGEVSTVSVLGGVITADVIRGQAEATANGGGSSISSAGTTITNLKINGKSYANVAPNTVVKLPLGLGSVTIDEEIGSTSGPAAGTLSGGTYSADLVVNALDVHAALVGTIILGHADAHADFPQTTLCAASPTQSVSGHAFIASETTTPSLIPILVGFVGIPSSGGTASQSLAAVTVPSPGGSIVNAGVAASSTTGTVTSTSSTSTSKAAVGDGVTANSVSVLGGLITAKLLISQANSTATPTSASSNATGTQFLGLTVANVPIVLPVAPNTVIPLLGLGYVILNEQIPETGTAGHTGLTVRAIDVHVTLANLGLGIGADVIVDEAHSDATFIK